MSKRDNEHYVAWEKRIDAMLRHQQRKYEQSRPKDNFRSGSKKPSAPVATPAATEAPAQETT